MRDQVVEWACAYRLDYYREANRKMRKQMRVKSEFQIADIAGEHVLVPVGQEATSFNGVVALSDAAAYLLENMKTQKTKEELIELLTSEYEVEPDVAEKDLDNMLKSLFEMGALEE